jgi:transposase
MEGHKKFREWTPERYLTEGIRPADVLPEDDVVFFLLETVSRLDLSVFYAYYEAETRGAPPFSVPMMCTLLVYAYSIGVFSSRKIAAACERNLAFIAIVGSDAPDFRTISEFRKHHLDAFEDLFVKVLRLAAEAKMIKLGNLALDGSKFKANASRHKAMSYGYMTKEVERLRAEIQELTRKAQQTDAEEDAALGSRRGDELPEELKRRQNRLLVIEGALKRLEAEAAEKAAAEQRRRDEAQAEREATGKKRGGRPAKPVDSTPEDKAQTNFTDATAKIMKTSNKGFDYAYNAQATVDGEHQIIVCPDVTAEANDKQQAGRMASKTREMLEAVGIAIPGTPEQGPAEEPQAQQPQAQQPQAQQPQAQQPQAQQPVPPPTLEANTANTKIPMTMDNGYFSEDAVQAVEAEGFDPHIAVGRQKHNQPQSEDVDGPPPACATVKEKMAHKLRTKSGRACYAQRKQIVEPVFGQIKHVRGFRQFLLRGLKKVRAEWHLICLTHNLLKIWRYQYALT